MVTQEEKYKIIQRAVGYTFFKKGWTHFENQREDIIQDIWLKLAPHDYDSEEHAYATAMTAISQWFALKIYEKRDYRKLCYGEDVEEYKNVLETSLDEIGELQLLNKYFGSSDSKMLLERIKMIIEERMKNEFYGDALQYSIFYKHYFEHISIADLALEYNISVSKVSNFLWFTVKFLKEYFSKYPRFKADIIII